MQRKLLPVVAAVCTVGVLAAVSSAAAPKRYSLRATLAPAPHAVGAAHARGRLTGSITVGATKGTLAWKLTFSRLTGLAKAAQIRLAPSGTLLIPLCTSCRSGQGSSFSGPLGGHSQILRAILGGHTYVVVDTKKNPKGEIRGFLHAASPAA